MSPVVHTITVKPRQSQERYPMSDTVDTTETNDTELTPTDRRALLRKIAIGGAGAAAGAVMLNNGRVSAGDQGGTQVNGNAVELGETNTATDATIIDFTPATAPTEGPSAFSAGGYVPPATSPFPAGVGGYGDSTIANGVHGSTTAPAGFGVVAANLAPAPATPAATDPVPVGLAVASATGAQMRFVRLPGSVKGPTPGKHSFGELYADKDGTLWFTVPATAADPVPDDAPVRFVKLAGTPTAGSYHAIDPQRVYDSRQTGYTVKGALAPNTNRVVSVADGRNANGTTVTLKDAVPTGATAVQLNLTAANMTGPNFLSVTAGDKTSTTTSLLNWGPGDIQIANSITVPIDAKREIRVYCGDQTGSTDFIVDIFGYYL
jgi:hypothetical protein